MIAIILSSIALLAASTAAVLFFVEAKRNRKQNAEFQKAIKDLQGGITPDYEEAKKATKAVNEFNAGISSILGFDPYTAIQAQRNKHEEGDNG